MDDTHRYVGDHAQEVIINGNAVMVGQGDFLTPTKDDLDTDRNKSLIADGQLVSLGSFKEKAVKDSD